MNQSTRENFDRQLEAVLAELPQQVHDLLERIPLIVEDYPSERMLHDVGLKHRSDLCGLYRGRNILQRSIDDSGIPSDVVYLFRLGLMREAESIAGKPSNSELREQIRITILHELGHHHGLDEDDLDELGYG